MADLLPHREPVEPHVPKDEAAERYRTEVLSAASTLSKEYAAMFTGEPGDAEGKDARRKALVFELNRSGKYHDLKERLKEAAQGIIKERFFQGGERARGKIQRTVRAPRGGDARVAAHAGAAREPSRVALVDPVDRERLAECKALADEYEIDDEHDSADKWHQERLLVTRATSPRFGRTTARFCLAGGDGAKPRRRSRRRSCWTSGTSPRSARSRR